MGQNQLNQCYVSFRGQTADKDGHCQQLAGLCFVTKQFNEKLPFGSERQPRPLSEQLLSNTGQAVRFLCWIQYVSPRRACKDWACRKSLTVGARDFSSAVSGLCFAAHGFGLRSKMCLSANTESSRRKQKRPLVPRLLITMIHIL